MQTVTPNVLSAKQPPESKWTHACTCSFTFGHIHVLIRQHVGNFTTLVMKVSPGCGITLVTIFLVLGILIVSIQCMYYVQVANQGISSHGKFSI